MDKDHGEEVFGVFCDVLQDLVFMFAERADEDVFESDAGPFIRAGMEFKGQMSGGLRLSLPERMCKEVASNMLGVDEDHELISDGGQDSVKELLNTVCGQMLTRIAGTDPVFDLTVPEISPLAEEEWIELLESDTAISAIVDDNPVLLELWMD